MTAKCLMRRPQGLGPGLCYSKLLTIRLFVDPSYDRVTKTLRAVYS